jgi:hypothetical protein
LFNKAEKKMTTTTSLFSRQIKALSLFILFSSSAAQVQANNVGENSAWQFQTTQDKVNKGAIVDLIEKKKNGYYDSFRVINNTVNNTTIDKQFNCSVSANSTGNTGNNDLAATTSSPTLNSNGTTNAANAANAATNSSSRSGLGIDQLVSVTDAINSSQTNSGALTASVTGSTTSASNGAVSAGGGTSSQVLNSTQSNTGQQTASVSGSTACNGPLLNAK